MQVDLQPESHADGLGRELREPELCVTVSGVAVGDERNIGGLRCPLAYLLGQRGHDGLAQASTLVLPENAHLAASGIAGIIWTAASPNAAFLYLTYGMIIALIGLVATNRQPAALRNH